MTAVLIVVALLIGLSVLLGASITWLDDTLNRRQLDERTEELTEEYDWADVKSAPTPGADNLARVLQRRSVIL